MKVYIVVSWRYEEQTIHGVFDTREAAERYLRAEEKRLAASNPIDGIEVQEYVLNEPRPDNPSIQRRSNDQLSK